MNLNQFLADLSLAGVKLWVDGDELRVRAPKGVFTQQRRDLLSKHKAELISWLRDRNHEIDTDIPLVRVSREQHLPVSFSQQRMWFFNQLEPSNPFYNVAFSVRLNGSLNIVALLQSINEIIRRHEVLRTTFREVNGQLIQAIASTLNITIPVVDLRQLPNGEREIQTQRLAIEEAQHPFNLTSGPVLRGLLLHTEEAEHILLVTVHHIAFDGWSVNVLFQELAVLYEAFRTSQPSPLPERVVQYADFASWQRQWVQHEVQKTQFTYWKQQLQGAPSVLELPVDYPRPPVQSFRGAKQLLELPKSLSSALKSLSQREGVSLFMTLLAAFQTLLYRYTNQQDLVVGSPITNRNRTEIEGLIGFFVNSLVLRSDLSGNPKFRELLVRVQKVALEAYAHQDLPFERLVEELQLERSLSHNPLFQVMFAIQSIPEILALENLTLTLLIEYNEQATRCDLELHLWEYSEGIRGFLLYSTDLFEPATITRMTENFQTLLEGIVANPGQTLSELPLLSADERHQMLFEWNQTQADYPDHDCIHQLFEAQVERTPDAVAVVFENQQLTYKELNSRANQLAHYLRSLGVRADVLVGLCVERSVEMVVGLLGILKAGGAYVPLDPEYPTERLALIIEDAQISVLLTTHKLADAIPKHQARVICYNNDSAEIGLQTEENPTGEVRSDCLAYVIYTSGSTGKPKGVSVTHRSVNCLVMNTNYIHIEPFDVIAQASNYAFDAATFEIWGALLHGARLVGVSKDLALSPTDFSALIRGQGISVLFLTTALFNQIAQAVPSAFHSLRYLLFGGEAVDPKWVQEVLKNSAPQRLLHVYGPTENTTFTSWYLVQDVPKDATTIPIGRPIANTQVYILDEYLQPVPVGVPGELHIGGAGLARGYLNATELTVEKFIPNPFENSKINCHSSKLYKTGDLARYLPSGNIEYLGRIDFQVKIRGFRIELGEIEAVLNQHGNVQASYVIAREDIPGNKRLVAYIVPQQEVTPKISELRQFLKEKLPDYMVPSAMVILESLPLTLNGKIDRRALPVPESRTGIEVPIVLPRTGVEAKLALIWAQVLRVELVGIHDNFFNLGGDSILSIQIIARAKLAGIELTLKQLFAFQTIASLATVAGTTKALSIEQELVTGTLPLTPIQQWFFEQKLPQPHHFNQSFLLTVPSDIKLEILEQVWQQLLKHHDALRLRFAQIEGSWQQIHSDPTDRIAISCFDLSTLALSDRKTAIETTANQLQASLNLSENLVQVALFRLGIDQRARLLIVIHHLVVDGVSWRILLEDLHTGYQQLSEYKVIQLPAKTTAFKDWAQQLTEYAQANCLKSELAYWLSTSNSSVSPIPFDYAQGVNTVASTSIVSVSLTEAETHYLLQDVPKAYKTQINDVLLTALVLVLSRWTNSKSVLFNLEGHGREDIINGVDLSRTVGWFTTIFPVVLKLEAIDLDNIAQALKSVKEQLRAIPNKGIGYGLLRYLNEDALISAQLQTIPTAQISFNYLGQFAQVLNTSSLISPASESSGQIQSLQGERPYLIDINAIIANERLQIDWTYSSNIHLPRTIENIALEFVATLQKLIAHCLSPENAGYTPTDFPLVKLNQQELDGVVARLALKPELQSYSQNIEDIYPLSPMQEGMLFESLYAPDKGVYFEQVIYTLTGNLNVEAFEAAWQKVVARHSIFRTSFVWESLSQPLQVVYRQVQVTVDTYDWQELSTVEQLAQLETFLDSERQQGLQLSPAPLMRLHLLQMSENTYQFVWCTHHILLDGWSLPLVLKDLFSYYQAISQGESLLLQPTISYRNYIAWLQQQDLDLAKEFWRQKLQGFSVPTPMTVDKPLLNRAPRSSYTEQQMHLTVPATAAVVSFARLHQLTMNNLVQATWGLLLSRYSSETDVVFGVTVSGRSPDLVGVESMVGLLINTVPVRVQISQETELLGLLKDLQAQHAESEQFSYSPLVEIQGLSDVKRGTSLFESIVVFENYPVDTAVLQDNGSFTLSNFRGFEQTNYPLTFVAIPGEQLWLKMSYDAGRFEHGAITRMLGHFVTMLEAIVANPIQRISQLPLLTASESQQLLVEWNDTWVDYPQDKCIHQLFEEQVERTPESVAVVYENQHLTYGELNTKANQLAHYLRSMGVGADVLVGICVERSLSMVVGLLGILKAGGAYVPLDPEYPTDRLSFMLEDAQVSVLLTQQQLLERLPEQKAHLVYLDIDHQELVQTKEIPFVTEVKPSNLAYVLYTSGSTGRPKTVAIEHHSPVALVSWAQSVFTLKELAGVLASTSICFDLSVFELFVTLSVGGKVIIAENAMHLSTMTAASQVTLINTVPSVIAELIREQDLPQLVCTVNLAGEALQNQLVQQIYQHSKTERVFNLYGPSEDTTYSTYSLIEKGASSKTTIGRPIANTQIYILDQYLQTVPVGVPGELHIGGAGLARSYLNSPELTVEKFIPNPFDNSKVSQRGRHMPTEGDPPTAVARHVRYHATSFNGGNPRNGVAPHERLALASAVARNERHPEGVNCHSSKLYKTGDLARYLPDGNIEYLGRIDFQVKIRGFRIELGEIEAVLSQHPLVQQSVVVATDNSGDKRLVAYLVPALHRQALPQEVAQWQSEYVSDWQTLYEKTYSQKPAATDDVTFNITGWNSSYTRQPIPGEEMREWVESTVTRIQAQRPQRVLEIGCGTGLLLSRLAQDCQEYWGIDYSRAAIEYVQQLCSQVAGLEHVRLRQQMADNFEGIPIGEFDTVILNSVVQYFPSVEYLLQVIAGAMAAIDFLGTIFVGDVRSLALLEPYHAAVQLSITTDSRTIEQWHSQVTSASAGEEELVIDPSFFIALRQNFPQITWVEIQPKRGHAQNELTQFRYDVILHVGSDVEKTVVPWLNWQLDGLSLTQIQNQLQQELPELLGIRGVPNQRVQQALQIWEWWEHPPAVETVGQLRQLLGQQPVTGINPEQLWEMGQDLGYTVHLSWWESSHDGCYDVVFCRLGSMSHPAVAFWDKQTVNAKPWSEYTNNPWRGKIVQKVVPQVREFVQQKLPDYMVPSAFVILESLPLTPNGKIDRRALPDLEPNHSVSYIPPRNSTEKAIADIFIQVLQVERVGINDNFFELGGHSLKATQIISRLRETLSVELPLRWFLKQPTVADLALNLEEIRSTIQKLQTSIRESDENREEINL